MERDIRIAAVQFEYRDADKDHNLAAIGRLARAAVERGAELVCFHECCIPAYTFLRRAGRGRLEELAEPVPGGPSTRRLMEISRDVGAPLAAGLVERDGDRLHNTYVVVDGDALVARFRKLHPFVSRHFTPGDEFLVFDLLGTRFGILICYDNNLPENVRITAMMGADIVLMPHVTGCLDSPLPGRGRADPALWAGRERDPARLRLEFLGPKGRGWLMRWLPARAYENGVYAVFTNAVGMDDGQVRNGNSMVLDPYGEVVAECNELGEGFALATCTPEKLADAPGRRYRRARRPDLYGPLTAPPDEPPVTAPGWDLGAPPEGS